MTSVIQRALPLVAALLAFAAPPAKAGLLEVSQRISGLE